MKQLIVIYTMFTFKQQMVLINENHEVEQTSYIANDKLEAAIMNYAYKQGVKDITIKGNKKVTAKLKDNLLKTEFKLYNKNELKIALI